MLFLIMSLAVYREVKKSDLQFHRVNAIITSYMVIILKSGCEPTLYSYEIMTFSKLFIISILCKEEFVYG